MASAFMIAAGVAAAALAGRAIVRSALQGGGSKASGGMMAHFTRMTGGAERGFEEPMSRAEAAKILGISTGADKDAISKVHRKLMIVNHPDRGGSPYIAMKVNEAKEVLTGGANRSSMFR
mmetsp:Transcript_20364/g.50034  ORF Transcript_20364/g.50034 Transcript_20364/m.50034 type:complete len:120 (-) Transcript_20364:305-664(-)|eukprot:CAMPEP_0206248164 /NCGR_PEP_ID=MMETSP0047_2-20121206/20220_1 /ASSEMBLY_ACC=CAM_ASM_000192 /TAXON_ID=195065 /ORGANISM="Chroomonas mesostigmatica_cf, Strain CCMP1168" /LENGTH=119 /DNA_ID=CAMNT_0053673783 /DNA_START=307 /DNA_END=666 /DNA_ORIENTATION=+